MAWVQSSVALSLVVRDQVLYQHRDQLGLRVRTVTRLRDDAVQL